MDYISTRDSTHRTDGWSAILDGIAADGGLYIPEALPLVDVEELPEDYGGLSRAVLSLFFGQIPSGTPPPCSLTMVSDRSFLELWHGPTAAFKDMALTIFPSLLQHARKVKGRSEEIVILTATSGDTGSAALSGFSGIDGVKILVFYPEGGVSPIQERQMLRHGDNARAVAVRGNFDDCQTAVKQIFLDDAYRKLLDKHGYKLSSANSINIGRLVPQIVYYFYTYKQLVKLGEIAMGESINVAVPTGNFGNLLAGLYAKQMGLPINKLIAASNENSVVAEFLQTGRYDRRRELKLTSSPSMDILVSSNLERFLACFMDSEEIILTMDTLAKDGYYEVDPTRFKHLGVLGDMADEAEASGEVAGIYAKHDYLIDPHTAVASRVYDKYRERTGDETLTVIVSTASPYKFADSVAQSLGVEASSDAFETIRALEAYTGQAVPAALKELDGASGAARKTVDKRALTQEVSAFLEIGGESYG